MGQGTRLARILGSEEAAQAVDDLKDQLLIVFLNRLGGKLTLPIAEVDGTWQYNMTLSVDQDARTMSFKTEKKQ